ncbi:MAG: LCP family protein [Tissierellales bacterium]
MRKRFFKAFFISLLIFSILWTGIIYKLINDEAEYTGNFIQRIIKSPDEITFLLLGVDTNDGSKSGSRTDTMMLFKVDKKTGKISVLSIPRDTRTRIRGRAQEDKINHAHAYGGPELSVKAVKDLLGIELEYYVKVDYQIVKEFVDLIGGVEVDVPMDIKGTNIKKGVQVLNGEQAMEFLRFRKGYIDQDLGRIRAQQQFIKAAAKQTLKLNNIGKIPQMIKSYYNNIETNIPLDLILKFAASAKDYDLDGMKMATLPGKPAYINGISYFICDEEEAEILVKELFKDEQIVSNKSDN